MDSAPLTPEEFGSTPVQAGTSAIGDRLRRARQAMGMTLGEFASRLRIPTDHLAALEESRFDDLPALVYVRGYLMRVAKTLDVPPEVLLQQFDQEIAWRRPESLESDRQGKFHQPPALRNSFFSPFVLRWVGLGIVVAVVVGYLLFSASGIVRTPALVVTDPAADGEVTSDTISVQGTADPDARLTLNGQPIDNRDGAFTEQVGVQNGLNIIEVRATNRLGRISTVQRRIQASLPASAPGAEVGVSVILNVVGQATVVTIVADNRPFFHGTMLPGTEKLLEASETIAISVGNGSSVSVTFAGKKWLPLDSNGGPISNFVIAKGDSVADADAALAAAKQ